MKKDDIQFKRIKHIMSNTFFPPTALFFMPRQNQNQKPKKKVGGLCSGGLGLFLIL